MKEIEIGSRKFQIKELSYLDVIELSDIPDKRKHATKLLTLSGITEDQVNSLTIPEGSKLMDEINSLNGFTNKGDFHKTSSIDKGS